MSRYRTSPHYKLDTAQPEASMSYAQRVVKALWAQDDARMNAEIRNASLPQVPIATMRVPR